MGAYFFKDNKFILDVQEPTLGFEPRMCFHAALQEQCNTIMRSRLIRTSEGIRTPIYSFRRRMHLSIMLRKHVVEQTGIEPVSLGLQSSTLTNSVTDPLERIDGIEPPSTTG